MDSATHDIPQAAPQGARLPAARHLADDVERLAGRLEVARSRGSDRDALVQDLETAYEELRAADEEVRSQSESIGRLVASRENLRVQQERTLAILPVPVVLTDRHGTIRTVNAAAALVMNVRVDRLLGKPLFSWFAVDDRRALRQLVAHRPLGVVGREVATLLPRGSAARDVEVVVTGQPELTVEDEICWMLLTAGGPDDTATGGGGVTESLAELALLAHRVDSRRELAAQGVRLVRRGLRDAAEVSVALGPATEPEALASTSQAAQHWDGTQVAAGEGPSVSAFRTGLTTVTADAGGDPRWPGLARQQRPPRAVLATPVQSGERPVGVLTAYGDVDLSACREVVELFAVALGSALHEVELARELDRMEDDMQRALASRAVIDQAKGILMAAHGIDANEAWDHLLTLSSSQHLKVRDLAQRIVERAAAIDR